MPKSIFFRKEYLSKDFFNQTTGVRMYTKKIPHKAGFTKARGLSQKFLIHRTRILPHPLYRLICSLLYWPMCLP
jgi:hypothetical protein